MKKLEWNSKYWDIVYDFYWSPKYLGFQSIGRKKWTERDGLVCIPSNEVNKNGPIYTRALREGENADDLKRKEEILNHIFNLTFGIAATSVVQKLLFEPLGFEDQGPIESLGREVRTRYGWGEDNVTQQDGLFVSPASVVGVELKTGARASSSDKQILKYALLMCCEECNSGQKENAGLLFIVPEKWLHTHWQRCGVPDDGQIDRTFLDLNSRKELMTRLLNSRTNLSECAFLSLLDRLKLAAISWSEFLQAMSRMVGSLDQEEQGGQTLTRLLGGLCAQITEQEGTDVGRKTKKT